MSTIYITEWCGICVLVHLPSPMSLSTLLNGVGYVSWFSSPLPISTIYITEWCGICVLVHPHYLTPQMFTIYIKRATELFGITHTREIYEKAIEVLPDTGARYVIAATCLYLLPRQPALLGEVLNLVCMQGGVSALCRAGGLPWRN